MRNGQVRKKKRVCIWQVHYTINMAGEGMAKPGGLKIIKMILRGT